MQDKSVFVHVILYNYCYCYFFIFVFCRSFKRYNHGCICTKLT